jgi:hypothetical protein
MAATGGFTWRAVRATMAALGALDRSGERAFTGLRQDLALASQLRPRPDDLYLVGFPRSGLSLLQMALHQLTTDGEMSFVHVASISPTLENEVVRAGRRYLEQIPAPRVFKSHLLYERLPRPGRVVYLARDVGDVAVSAYHYCALLAGRELDLDDFLHRFVAGHPKLGGVTWFEHLRSWWPHRGDPDVLFLDYDEVVADLAGTLRRLAGFCGLALDARELPRMVERCGFAFMRRHEARFDPRRRHLSGRVGSFVRKGEPGGGKAELSARHRERMASETARLGRALGCRPGDPHAGIFTLD